MFTEDSIQELKQKISIVGVIEDFVALKPAGVSFIGCCPFHNERTPSFHVHPGKDMYKCFGCGKSGDSINFIQDKENLSYPEALRYLATKYNVELTEEGKQTYTKPVWKNNTTLSPSIVKWFEDRKISQNTLIKMRITEGLKYLPQREKEVNCMHFNYFRNDELVNVKYRDSKKNMVLEKGAELILYNLDSLIGKTEAIIVEGECDQLALVEAGYDKDYAVLSVPNGASAHRNNLQYLNNCIKECEHITKWHLGFDNDSNGRKLRDEFADRFGKDKCNYIEWKDKKDANDVLMQYGIQGVIDCCSKPVKFPLEGAFTISDFSYEIEDLKANGLDKGVTFGLRDFPLRIVKGYITVVTGISGHGKSEAVDDMCLRLTLRHKWNGAFYSPENKPTQLHYAKMARRLTGKDWEGKEGMTKAEEMQVRAFLEKKVWFIKPEKDFSLTSVLQSIKDLKMRFGIDYFVIDAWNKLTHKSNDVAEIEKALNDLAMFCEIENLHCFLVAHPKKPEMNKKTMKVEVPKLWDISGSNNFHNKADNGISIYLDRETNVSTWHLLKVKFSHWGWVCSPEYKWEKSSGRYFKEGFPDNTNWITGENIKPNEPQIFGQERTGEDPF